MYPKSLSNFVNVKSREDIKIESNSLIARGYGRSYGDSAIQPKQTVDMRSINKIINFNRETGEITAQAGLSIDSLLKKIIPFGWFMPVTPGSKFISVGGMVAADVHGKNHHKEGSFFQFIDNINLITEDDVSINCSRDKNVELFRDTIGGMGLTGIILDVSFRLKKIDTSYIKQEKIVANNLNQVFDLFELHKNVTYTVAWLDCLSKKDNIGRSIFYMGEHAKKEDLLSSNIKEPLQIIKKFKKRVLFNFPSWILNNYTIRLFNFLVFYKNHFNRKSLVDYDSFFYPLDSIENWNRIYGNKGFLQYQFVLPLNVSKKGITEILNLLEKNNSGSFLAVLKLFGKKSEGTLSFPVEGYTLTLDFPVTKKNLLLMNEVDNIILKYGGKVYLAKDSRMKAEIFSKMYKNEKNKLSMRSKKNKFSSLQSERLGL
jgi:FAD/FMN-containing dehydrogenase